MTHVTICVSIAAVCLSGTSVHADGDAAALYAGQRLEITPLGESRRAPDAADDRTFVDTYSPNPDVISAAISLLRLVEHISFALSVAGDWWDLTVVQMAQRERVTAQMSLHGELLDASCQLNVGSHGSVVMAWQCRRYLHE